MDALRLCFAEIERPDPKYEQLIAVMHLSEPFCFAYPGAGSFKSTVIKCDDNDLLTDKIIDDKLNFID